MTDSIRGVSPHALLRLALLALLLVGTPAAAFAPSERSPSTDSTPVLQIEHGDRQQQLSLADIESLPLYEVDMAHPEGLEGEFTGVLIDDLFEAYGLADEPRVRLIAADDFTTFLTPTERVETRYLLATRFAGEPISAAQNGPLMLVAPDEADDVLAGRAPMTKWIWSLTTLRAL